MKKKESSALVEAVLLSNCIANDVYDDIFLHDTLMQRKEVKALTDIDKMFDESEKVVEQEKSQSSKTEQSIFLSNKFRDTEITNTYLIDTVVAMSIKMSMIAKRTLTTDFIAQHCVALAVIDKFEADDSKLVSKMKRRVSSHLVANSKRKKSALYKQVTVTNNEVLVSADVKRLVCQDFSCMF